MVLVFKPAYGFDDQVTHPQLTEWAVSKAELKIYFINTLGFTDDIKTKLNVSINGDNHNGKGWSIIEILRAGSTLEDSMDFCRASNHFHDPTKLWPEAGVTDGPQFLMKYVVCRSWSPFYSNLVWATGYRSRDLSGADKVAQYYDGTKVVYGWDRARQYYYSALTGISNSARESDLGESLVTLGHVMHLLEDMGVPAHVRNDFSSHFA